MQIGGSKRHIIAVKALVVVLYLTFFTAQVSYKFYQWANTPFSWKTAHPVLGDKKDYGKVLHLSLDKRYQLTPLFLPADAGYSLRPVQACGRKVPPPPFPSICPTEEGTASLRGPPHSSHM